MTGKETFLNTWEREFQTTLKVLKAYPPAKLDLKPHERSRSARELAWTFVVEEKGIDGIIAGKIDFQNLPPAGDGRAPLRGRGPGEGLRRPPYPGG